MTTTEKKTRGRPRRYVGDRPNWTIRLDVEVGDRIKQMAEKSGRSIAEVCEKQIVDSFRMDIMLGLLEAKIETLEASRASLMLRVEELVSLLSLKTAGAGADARNVRERHGGIFARRKGRRHQKIVRPRSKAV